MPTTDLLKTFGLSRNPFTDRTAEKTELDAVSLYRHSDLQGFRPSETTYVFFGKRGSGKTTIRLMMDNAYAVYNKQAVARGESKGHFMVDLCRPGHMTACLSSFSDVMRSTTDNWDAVFQDSWRSSDMVDCILSYSATLLVQKLGRCDDEQRAMVEALRQDPKATKQLLLLAHMYARTDSAALDQLRRTLLRPQFSATQVTVAIATGGVISGAVAASVQDERTRTAIWLPVSEAIEGAADHLPVLRDHPRVALAALGALVVTAAVLYGRTVRSTSLRRAQAVQQGVRVVPAQPLPVVAALLDSLFPRQDSAETILQLSVGISAHQKLDLLQRLVQLLGYESVAVFGDCFDEVTLLDPVRYPGAIKIFAREVCRNDLLNFGRLHFFFPDSRLALDLNTDKTLKEARFDRHFVRDLTWSRHQLEELAERRFRAAQETLQREAAEAYDSARDALPAADMSFADLFKKVRGEDFSSYIAKLSTPRELMIMMTEMFSRIEAHPDGGLTAQDMEISVTKALEQSV